MSATVRAESRVKQDTDGFITVPRQILRCLDTTCVDLFVRYGPHDPVVLFREAEYPVSSHRADDLRERGPDLLFVRSGDFSALCRQLFESLDPIMRDEDLTRPQRFEVLQTAIAMEVEQSLRLINCNKFVSLSLRLGQQITSLLSNSKTLPRDIFQIARHDCYTFVHVTNVTSYAVLLAEKLGIRNQAELKKIAVGSMLHDIGKRFIPQSILTKPAALTDSERSIIQSHPHRGYEELYQRDELDFGQLMIVYQHHERMDGKGYPVGILGDEIHPWAKMLAVVDVFEAMTGKRPYRRPATVTDAIDFLNSRAGTQFDEEMVSCWTSEM